jgi:hypothetical protein
MTMDEDFILPISPLGKKRKLKVFDPTSETMSLKFGVLSDDRIRKFAADSGYSLEDLINSQSTKIVLDPIVGPCYQFPIKIIERYESPS